MKESKRNQYATYNEALKLIIHHKRTLTEFSKKGALRKIRKKTDLPKELSRKSINDIHSLVLEGKTSYFQ